MSKVYPWSHFLPCVNISMWYKLVHGVLVYCQQFKRLRLQHRCTMNVYGLLQYRFILFKKSAVLHACVINFVHFTVRHVEIFCDLYDFDILYRSTE